MKELKKDELKVLIFPDRNLMAEYAAKDVSEKINQLLEEKAVIRIIFAAAPSQVEFLGKLVANPSIDWGRIEAFHLDEYIGLAENAPQTFGNFLRRHIFDKVSFRKVSYINHKTKNVEDEDKRYGNLLMQAPIDIICMGIGENGHIAFNDPPVADFNDRLGVKIVDLDQICRQQQVNDGCFEKLTDVPTKAFTVTIPTLLSATYLFCIVPAKAKAQAVYRTLNDPISESCPATILRQKKEAILYLDNESSMNLNL
jgi:glucosamine-6-phosphate deaminase